jgi:hypothetical protein
MHVEVDHFAQLDAGVEPLGYNVEGFVADDEVELNVRVSGQEAGDQRAGEEAVGYTGNMEAKGASWFLPQLAHRGDRGSELIERRPSRGVEAFAGFGEPDTAGGAAHQRYAEPLLQSTQGLAHGRTAYPEAFACGPKALGLSYGDKHGDPIEVVH